LKREKWNKNWLFVISASVQFFFTILLPTFHITFQLVFESPLVIPVDTITSQNNSSKNDFFLNTRKSNCELFDDKYWFG